MVDWLADFNEKYFNDSFVNSVKKNKLHGSITINFSDGAIMSCEAKFKRLPATPVLKVTIRETIIV